MQSSARAKGVPVSTWRPVGGLVKLPRDFFNVVDIPLGRDAQGVARMGDVRNGYKVLDGVCVVLPIEKYEFVRGRRNRTRKARGRRLSDCVSFVARTPDLIVDLTWSNNDDLDLIVKGPFKSPGKLVSGDVVSSCRGGQETHVVENVSVGRYSILYKFHANIDPPTATPSPNGFTKIGTSNRWHYPIFPLFFCTFNPRDVLISKSLPRGPSGERVGEMESVGMENVGVRHGDGDGTLVLKDRPDLFEYKVTVTYKGVVIGKREGVEEIGEHGIIGKLRINCSSKSCKMSKKSSVADA